MGKVVTISAFLLGISLMVLSYIDTYWIAALICLPAGFAIISTVASINTLLQTLSDEDKRGRVMGYLAMTFTGIAPVGSMFLGSLEKQTGLPAIILISGVSCALGGIIFEYYRPLVRKHARQVYIRKGIIQEIATGIDATEEQI